MKIQEILNKYKNAKELLKDIVFHAKKISKRTGKNKIKTCIDITYSKIKYKILPAEYNRFRFYKKSLSERKNYIGFQEISKYQKEIFNINIESQKQVGNKNEFNRNFKSFTGRESLYAEFATKDEFIEFVTKNNQFVSKILDGNTGIGFKKHFLTKKDEFESIFEEFKGKKIMLEGFIKQNKDLIKLNKSSVNTIRVEVLIYPNRIEIPGYFLRVGTGANVDNFGAGGIAAGINSETGTIETDGINKEGDIFEKHPISNKKFIGFKIPLWNEVKELVRAATDEVKNKYPGIRHIGWDIAITDEKALLVEGNCITPSGTVLSALYEKENRKLYIDLAEEWRKEESKIKKIHNTSEGDKYMVARFLKVK